MKKLLINIATMLILFPSLSIAEPASDELAARRATELLEEAQTGKDGAYSVAEKFAECRGMYEALADYIEEVNEGDAMALTLRNTGNGAGLVALFFWSGYSKKPKTTMQYISENAKIYFTAILSVGGVSDKAMTDKMFYCGSLTSLQATIIAELRKG